MSGKKYDDISFVSNKADLSTLSGLVASRTLPSEDSREKYGSQQVEIANQVKESLNLSGEPMKKHDQKCRMENLASSRHLETGRATKGPVLVSFILTLSLCECCEIVTFLSLIPFKVQ